MSTEIHENSIIHVYPPTGISYPYVVTLEEFVTGATYLINAVNGATTVALYGTVFAQGPITFQRIDSTANAVLLTVSGAFTFAGGGTTYTLNVGASVQFNVFNNVFIPVITTPAATQGYVLPSIGKLCEYRFDEGSGSVVTDYSGNGNTGAYVGSPTFVGGGGFLAAGGTKYATGTNGAISTMQTMYLAFDYPVTDSLFATGQGVPIPFGNSTNNFTAFNLYCGATSPGRWSGVINCGGTITQTSVPGNATIVAILYDIAGVQNTRVWINGVEAIYASQGHPGSAPLKNVPWFGKDGGGYYFSGNIYYFASYSTYQTASQIVSNSQIIRNIMLARGNAAPSGIGFNSTTSQLAGVGDSITFGEGVTGFINLVSTYQPFTVSNFGAEGRRANQLINWQLGAMGCILATCAARNIATIMIGVNDIANSESPDSIWQYTQGMCIQIRRIGWQVVLGTVLANNGSSNAQNKIDQLNALIRQGWRGVADEFMDFAADPVLGAAGANTNATWFQSDHLHPTLLGQQRMAIYAQAAINRLCGTSGLFVTRYSQVGNVSVTNTTAETSIVGGSAFINNTGWFTRTYIANTHTSTTIDGFGSTADLVVGQSVTGSGVAANTTISTIASATSITVNNATSTSVTACELTFGNIPVKGGFWRPGQAIKIESEGLLSTGTAQTLNRQFKIGGTVFAATGVVTLPTSLSAVECRMELTVTCVTIGSSANGGTNGTFWAQGALTVETSAGVVTRYPMSNASVVSLDTTADAIIDITDTWVAASASNIDNVTNLTIRQTAP